MKHLLNTTLPTLELYTDYVNGLSRDELEDMFIIDFHPSVEKFSSEDEARQSYANFLFEQAVFFQGYEKDLGHEPSDAINVIDQLYHAEQS